jgi:hypothetical protein
MFNIKTGAQWCEFTLQIIVACKFSLSGQIKRKKHPAKKVYVLFYNNILTRKEPMANGFHKILPNVKGKIINLHEEQQL